MKIHTEEKPYWWDDNSGYGSHIYALQFIFEHITVYNALECGMGIYSTPFILDNVKEFLTSVEMQDAVWFNKILNETDYAITGKWIYNLSLSDELPDTVMRQNFDFVLSDGAAFTRPLIINHFMDKGAETLVGHDTESEWYGWNRVREDLGYYKYTLTDIAPYTTVS